jgi:hypothetical protein
MLDEKVTDVPEQMLEPTLELIAMVGVTDVTVMLMLLLVAVLADTQVNAEVIIQLTASPLLNELVMKVAELVPAFNPFTFHW